MNPTLTLRPARLLILATLLFGLFSPSLSAEPLRVGIKTAAPFAMQDEQGEWSGISVDLWREAANSMGQDWRFIPMSNVGELVHGLAAGELDVAVGALSVTAEREAIIDFSHPFYNAGLGIATRSGEAGLFKTLGALFSWQFFSAVSILFILLLAVGVLIWLLERHKNPDQFGSKHHGGGIAAGFWWSAVTMTTVGYGDKAPVTAAGRIIAVIWMFAGIITISGFTAAIAAVFTVQSLNTLVSGPEDLDKVSVVTVAESTGAEWLRSESIRASQKPSAEAAIKAVAGGQAGAAVYDAPILRYLIQESGVTNVEVLNNTIVPEDYAFGLQQNSPLRQALNMAILRRTETAAWAQGVADYLGEQP